MVFLRTFSLLILTEILQEDNERPFLSDYTPEWAARYHNLKTFLRSLYFQLRLASSASQAAPMLLAELERAIEAMDRGYYELS